MTRSALLTTDEVAALLRVHPKHVYRLLKKGLPARRVGAEWRYDSAEVLAWAGGPPPQATTAAAAQDEPPSLVAANGDLAVELLLRLARDRGAPLLGLVPADMGEGLALLERAAVLAAGAHAGAFPAHVGAERVARVHLVEREVGLMSREREPPEVEALAKARLASRPPSAGVRRHLDRALALAGLDGAAIHRAALLLGSHLDVAVAVASGRADVGIGSRAWAARMGLGFRPLAREGYGLLVRARHLGDPRVVRLCETAQSAAYRREAGAVPGYDAAAAGDVRYDG